MGKNRASRFSWAFSVLTISLLLAGCGGGGSHDSSAGTEGTDPGSAVTFTYSLDSGQVNSLPDAADHIDVVLDGKEINFEVPARITVYAEGDASETGTQTLAFSADPGEHTFTITALQGKRLVAMIGPITFTKVDGIPVNIPIAFGFTSFDHHATKVGTNGADAIITFGSDVKDRVVQYGGAGNDFLSFDAKAGDDWIEQHGGDGGDTLVVEAGTGNDYTCQEGGDGDDHLVQVGGAGNDTIRLDPGLGNDAAAIDAGPGNDSITYDMADGTDTVTIDGNDGNDLLTININGVMNYTIKDSSGTIFSDGTGGTTLTVEDIEGIRLVDEYGDTISTWGNPPSPAAPAVPVAPDKTGFDNPVDPVLTADPFQLVSGTVGSDLITMYGGTGNVEQFVDSKKGDDWILQVTEGTTCRQRVVSGDGSDTVYQFITGRGSATQVIEGGTAGIQTFVQVGGQGVNHMSADDSGNSGSALISQFGGPAGNTMEVTGSKGDDLISMYGGAGNDTMTYDLTSGNDAVLINGDAGDNTLTINTQGIADYTLKGFSGNELCTSGAGGTVITALNVQHITVVDLNGDTVWSR